jgi:hypothetical protein
VARRRERVEMGPSRLEGRCSTAARAIHIWTAANPPPNA